MPLSDHGLDTASIEAARAAALATVNAQYDDLAAFVAAHESDILAMYSAWQMLFAQLQAQTAALQGLPLNNSTLSVARSGIDTAVSAFKTQFEGIIQALEVLQP